MVKESKYFFVVTWGKLNYHEAEKLLPALRDKAKLVA